MRKKSKIHAPNPGDILHYVEKLKQVDVTGVEPMAHASSVFNVRAPDVPAAGCPSRKPSAKRPDGSAIT